MINNFEDFTEELNPDELKLVAPLMNGLRTKTKQNPIKAPEIVKAMNVLNKNYEVIRSFPMPGRYYQFRLKYAI